MKLDPHGNYGFDQARETMLVVFRESMGSLDKVDARLAAALADVMANTGSMIRATTAYQVGRQVGLSEEIAQGIGCGMECMHTASLILDDFPAMDDARTRRGMPCLHVTHGEGIATLAALALINRAYGLLWQGIETAPTDRRRTAASLVEECLGLSGLVGGQAMDLRGWREQQEPAEVIEVAARKTAALLRLTVVLPALVGNVAQDEVRLLDRLSFYRGLAYQAADDLKDVAFQQEEGGKTAGRDEQMGRPNLVLAEGITGAMHRMRRLESIGDRLHRRLLDRSGRWGMLAILRVSVPWPAHLDQTRRAQ